MSDQRYSFHDPARYQAIRDAALESRRKDRIQAAAYAFTVARAAEMPVEPKPHRLTSFFRRRSGPGRDVPPSR